MESEPIVDEGNGSCMFSAKVSFDELRERLDLDIESEGFETVGGYILSRAGRVPSVETLEVDGLSVEVLEAERRRILGAIPQARSDRELMMLTARR